MPVWSRFRRHRLGVAGGIIVSILLLAVAGADFLAPYGLNDQHSAYANAPPTRVRFVDAEGQVHFRPFVYGIESRFDLNLGTRVFRENTAEKHFIQFFVQGTPYKVGPWTLDTHLFGVEGGVLFLVGADQLGRDLFSRILHGGRVSMTIAIIATIITTVIGACLGAISGYYGGRFDMVIQRVVELLKSFPDIPLWMALSAAIPSNLSPLYMQLSMAGIFALLSWPEMCRQVRGLVLRERTEEYVDAAKAIGAQGFRVWGRHILPNVASQIIVVATLVMPNSLLVESTLSFFGLGIVPPTTSWGVLLRDAQNLRSLQLRPWTLVPGLVIVIAVLGLNFLGDGLRDAVDPESKMRGASGGKAAS